MLKKKPVMIANKPPDTSDARITTLRRSVDRSYQGPAWHGPTLMSSLRGVTPEEAAWRPQPERHNVWELLVHCAYWKYRVCARLAELPRGSFGLKGSNFFERPVDPTTEAWNADLQLLQDWHGRLLEAIASFDAGHLDEPVGGNRYTYEELIDGAGAHDVYHAGQIQLLKKLRKNHTD